MRECVYPRMHVCMCVCLQVRQCFQQYSFLKKRGRRLCMWAQGFDRGLPTAKETAKVEDAIRQLELRGGWAGTHTHTRTHTHTQNLL